jgi:hypothetical protein
MRGPLHAAMIRGGHRSQGWEGILRGIGMSCRSRDGRSVAGRVAVAATECRGGLLPLGRASLAATALPLEASNTEIWQSLLGHGSLGLGPPEGGARDRRRERRCAACVGWRGVPLGGGRGHDETKGFEHASARFPVWRSRLSQTFDWLSRLRVVVLSAPPLATEGAPLPLRVPAHPPRTRSEGMGP